MQVARSMLYSKMLPNERTRALLDSVVPREQAEENGIGETHQLRTGISADDNIR